MPYLPDDRKAQLDNPNCVPNNAGDLTYLFYKILLDNEGKCHWGSFQEAAHKFLDYRPPSYQNYCEVVGAVVCACTEFSRRGHYIGVGAAKINVLEDWLVSFYDNIVAPYEDKKIEENGDVV